MAMRFNLVKIWGFAGVMLAMSSSLSAAETISLQALFKDKAIIVVNGARHVLNSGEQGPDGIKLLATYTQEEKAEVEIGGKREVLKLGMVSTGFAPKGKSSVILYPGTNGHYFTEGLVNGVPVRFMVDTGATIIGISSVTAERIGIDYRKMGRPGYVNTAGGIIPTFYVKLNSVKVGEITMYNVDATVVEGSSPREALLGMSFLGNLNMTRDSEKMELSER
ncbi:MAG: TIGR02281 family clan AA aspartic protease [Gammaproteobacteria bacterium]|nr:TIGR02281 family clan AA aspartic protease [Gammaproteobacteria bacterium]MDH3370792.1 TIGR02281 family clan AA aspartic protease [Gammaproteobacteria bacterium]MDH3407687.1 TIGR02281 family clan AA aspartic protease [Gammaproteobacteria bacterium]